jgi:hypothetical protein
MAVAYHLEPAKALDYRLEAINYPAAGSDGVNAGSGGTRSAEGLATRTTARPGA